MLEFKRSFLIREQLGKVNKERKGPGGHTTTAGDFELAQRPTAAPRTAYHSTGRRRERLPESNPLDSPPPPWRQGNGSLFWPVLYGERTV